jgi:hypothetical protein
VKLKPPIVDSTGVKEQDKSMKLRARGEGRRQHYKSDCTGVKEQGKSMKVTAGGCNSKVDNMRLTAKSHPAGGAERFYNTAGRRKNAVNIYSSQQFSNFVANFRFWQKE